ncbi:MAG: cystathionine beta-lyase [Pseudomonadota bacterium]
MKNGAGDGTRLVHLGREPQRHAGTVNQPIYRASTILFPTYEAFKHSRTVRPGDEMTYGIHGTPATFALEKALAELEAGEGAVEAGYRTRLCNSGLQAVCMPILAVCGSGDHLLIPDNVYAPVRTFAGRTLKRMGIDATFYDPLIGGGIRDLMRPETKLVLVESPGSWTFEVQDIPAIAEEAHRGGAVVMMDNTWASPLYFRAFDHGVDISAQAVTKYVGGHSDLMMGSVTSTKDAYDRFIQPAWRDFGLCASPEDTFLAARGLRTMRVRLEAHHRAGLVVGEWLKGRPEVAEVIHPAMPHDPGHALWQRDFLGAASLFAFTLDERYGSDEALAALFDTLELHGMGFSWGGFESLLVPIYPERMRSETGWPLPGRPKGQVLRIHVGLEDTADLIDDLTNGFDAMRKAAG